MSARDYERSCKLGYWLAQICQPYVVDIIRNHSLQISDARQNLAELREKNSYKSRHHLKSSYTDTAGRMSEIKRLEHEQNMILADYQQQVNNANIKIDTLESQVYGL